MAAEILSVDIIGEGDKLEARSNPNPLMTTYHIIVFIVLPVFFIVLITVTGRFEKRLVWQYGNLGTLPPYPDVSAYARKWTDEALACGFILLGWALDPRAPNYRQNYALLVSPERDCFVVVCSGTIFNLKSQSVSIYTPTQNGKVYYTTANQNGAQIDLLGHWMGQLTVVNTFQALLRNHRNLLRDKGVLTQPFNQGRELEEFKRLRVERYETMARHGLITFMDGMETSWHFTLWGGIEECRLKLCHRHRQGHNSRAGVPVRVKEGSGSFGFWLRFRSVTGPSGHAPSLKPRQNSKIFRC
jgi:hypothetical protein